jgi:hypothetical protein
MKGDKFFMPLPLCLTNYIGIFSLILAKLNILNGLVHVFVRIKPFVIFKGKI